MFEHIRCFVLDMDGTIYLGNNLFPFTKDFLSKVKATDRDFYFFTNNSSKNKAAYLNKLSNMGIEVESGHMLISNQVIIKELREKYPGQSVYVVGTKYLVEDFKNAGIEINEKAPDIVVLGFDTELTYEKLKKICIFIREGKRYLAVNQDLNCPIEDGFIPDCGSMAALIQASTGAIPEYFGKPTHHTLNYILQITGCKPSELAIIGDRIYTDIALGEHNKEVSTILVLSGEASIEDIHDVKPNYIFNSLNDIIPLL